VRLGARWEAQGKRGRGVGCGVWGVGVGVWGFGVGFEGPEVTDKIVGRSVGDDEVTKHACKKVPRVRAWETLGT
jgi:hypothetical protein